MIQPKLIVSLIFLLLGATVTSEGNKEDDLVIKDEQINKAENTCKRQDGEKCGDEIKLPQEPQIEIKKKKENLVKEPQIDYPSAVEYEELFLQKGNERDEYLKSFSQDSNFTDYYDLSLDEKLMEHVKLNSLFIYPPDRFMKVNQGNFLHFMKIAYEKSLPVYLTTDMMLYPVIEAVNNIKINFLENVFWNLLVNFFQKLVDYSKVLMGTEEGSQYSLKLSHALMYYGIPLEILTKNIQPARYPEDLGKMIQGATEGILKYQTNLFYIMMKGRSIDTSLLIPPNFWRSSKKLLNIYTAIRWLQIARLDVYDETNSAWLLGKIIHDSGLKENYERIRKIYGYFIGEDRLVPNMLEFYELGKEKLLTEAFELSKPQIEEFIKHFEKIPPGTYRPDLEFTKTYYLYSAEQYEKFKYEKEMTTFIFNNQFTVENWILNKLIDPDSKKLKFLTSFYEYFAIMTQNSAYIEVIEARYQGDNKYGQLLKFRDNINFLEDFEKIKFVIKKELQSNSNAWKTNLLNHFHYLLYKCTRKIKLSSDPIYSQNIMKEKSFYTSVGAYIHFKKEINILEKILNKPGAKGRIPEVVLEPHKEFYQELEIFFNTFKDQVLTATDYAQEFLNISLQNITDYYHQNFNNTLQAIQIVREGIELQETGKLDEAWKKNLRRAFFYNKNLNKFDGWYTKMYETRGEQNLFGYVFWVYKLISSPPNKDLKYPGAIIYDAMKYPNIGILIKQDPFQKVRKLLLFATYNAGEYFKNFEQKISLKDIAEALSKRQ